MSITTLASTHVRIDAPIAARTPSASGRRNPLARPASSEPRRIASRSTASSPSRKRIVNAKKKAMIGAAIPGSASATSTFRSPIASSLATSSSSDSGAPSRMPFRSFANANSTSSTRFGSRRRSGISAYSKWSRYASRARS